MIDRAYCVTMARYNQWQNQQVSDFLADMPEQDLTLDRGAFFGSILGTINHLLWGDQMWMHRFAGTLKPAGGIHDTPMLHATLVDWQTARQRTDQEIIDWADALSDDELQGDLTWYSGAVGHDVSRPMAVCAVHLFNHQTHHRGQVHAMVTATGSAAPVSDLVFMPEDA